MAYNKKAQGEIITTILIILLVLAAIVIVWQVIQGTVEKGASELESQSECIGLNIKITNIDVDADSVTIRPNKDLVAWKVYVQGDYITDGDAVTAYETSTADLAGQSDVDVSNEVEVFGVIGEKVCDVGSARKKV